MDEPMRSAMPCARHLCYRRPDLCGAEVVVFVAICIVIVVLSILVQSLRCQCRWCRRLRRRSCCNFERGVACNLHDVSTERRRSCAATGARSSDLTTTRATRTARTATMTTMTTVTKRERRQTVCMEGEDNDDDADCEGPNPAPRQRRGGRLGAGADGHHRRAVAAWGEEARGEVQEEVDEPEDCGGDGQGHARWRGGGCAGYDPAR